MKINKEWHEKNKMPKNAKFKERVQWHLAHQKNCSCRPIPEKLLEDMKKMNSKHGKMTEFDKFLAGGDLRSIGKTNSVILKIQTQNDFNELFKCLFHKDRLVVMHAADAIEKITINNQQYLTSHKMEIIQLCKVVKDKELKWHLALLIPRLHLNSKEYSKAWNTLKSWAKDKTNSRIVRVNSIQGLFEMKQQKNEFENDFNLTLSEIENEKIPSITARIKKLNRNRIKF